MLEGLEVDRDRHLVCQTLHMTHSPLREEAPVYAGELERDGNRRRHHRQHHNPWDKCSERPFGLDDVDKLVEHALAD